MALLDQFGNPIDTSALKEEQAAPSITGVRSIVSGHPSAGLTPVRLARLLKQAEDGDATGYLELAEDMEEKDLHYRGVISTRKLQVSQLDASVIPGGETPDDIRNAELIEKWLERENREEEFFDIADAIGKGYSVQEIIWDMSESQWEPVRMEWRDPRWFEYDRENGKTLLLRSDSGELVPLHPFKFVVHAHQSKSGLPIRGGLARAAAYCYLFKNFDIKGWVTFAEVYGQPLRVGKYHSGATKDEKSKLLTAVASIGRDASAIIPESMMIEFIKSEITGSTDLFERLANYMDTQVSKLVLGQTTTTDAISGGHAVSKEHNEVREDIERADAKQIAAAVNRDVVRPYIDLNYGPQKVYPKIKIGRPEQVDVPVVIDAIEKLVPLGLNVSQKTARKLIGVEEPEEGEELLVVTVAAQPTVQTPEKKPDEDDDEKALAKAKSDALDPMTALINELADSGEVATALAKFTNPVEGLLANSSSYEEFTAALAEQIKEMDPEAMGKIIARSNFTARLAGNIDDPASAYDADDAGVSDNAES